MGLFLTGQEIKDLAEYAGFEVSESGELDSLEMEFFIGRCPDKGVLDDDGVIIKSNHIVQCEGCEADECMPLGEVTVIGYSSSGDK